MLRLADWLGLAVELLLGETRAVGDTSALDVSVAPTEADRAPLRDGVVVAHDETLAV